MFEKVREAWQRQGTGARAGLLFGLALLVAALVYLSLGGWRRDDQVLFTGLEAQDAATIVGELDRMKVLYRIGADEATILVDGTQVHGTRLKLMGKGLNLHGGVGFEIFNTTDFGVTEFAQKINYQRALQGELTRTIMSLDAVKAARVLLVLPDSGLFRRTTQKPKASIALTLRDNRTLQADQVLGIQRLVAASVPQIEAAAVTVLDQRGVTLSRNVDPDGDDAAIGLGGKGEFESYLARKVVAVLDRTFGPGSAIVSVDVTLNQDQVRTTREEVLPSASGSGNARAIVRSRSSSQSNPGSPTAPLAGPVDVPAGTVTSNTSVVGAIQPARTGASSSEIEYQNGRLVEQKVSKPGGVKRISVGVMLPKALPPERVRELAHVLSMAVGLNNARGDEIAISSLDQYAGAGSATSLAGAATLPTASPPGPAASDPVAALPSSRPASAGPWWSAFSSPTAIVLLAAVLALALFVGSRLRRPDAPVPMPAAGGLSIGERDRLLTQMRQWLGAREG